VADAELIALYCALEQQERLRKQTEAPPDSDEYNPFLEVLDAAWWSLSDKITAMQAQGMAGYRAKAGALLLLLERTVGLESEAPDRAALMLAEDLLREGEVVPPVGTVAGMA
jgi:hypothetical protein